MEVFGDVVKLGRNRKLNVSCFLISFYNCSVLHLLSYIMLFVLLEVLKVFKVFMYLYLCSGLTCDSVGGCSNT